MPARSKIEPFDSLLGTMPDPHVAKRIGVTTEAIRQRRLKLGIGPYVEPGMPSLERFAALVGALSDRYVGELLGVSPAVVRARRLLLGIPPAEPRKALDGYDTVLGLLRRR